MTDANNTTPAALTAIATEAAALAAAQARIDAIRRSRRNENARLRRAVRSAGHNIDGQTTHQVARRFYIHDGQLVDMCR